MNNVIGSYETFAGKDQGSIFLVIHKDEKRKVSIRPILEPTAYKQFLFGLKVRVDGEVPTWPHYRKGANCSSHFITPFVKAGSGADFLIAKVKETIPVMVDAFLNHLQVAYGLVPNAINRDSLVLYVESHYEARLPTVQNECPEPQWVFNWSKSFKPDMTKTPDDD